MIGDPNNVCIAAATWSRSKLNKNLPICGKLWMLQFFFKVVFVVRLISQYITLGIDVARGGRGPGPPPIKIPPMIKKL